MNIALDLDGCLSNFHFSFSKVANKLFGTPIVENIQDVKKFRWEDWHPLTKEQANLTWKEIDKNVSNFWIDALPLVEKSIFNRLEDLECNNHSIYFITSRRNTSGKNVLQQTNEWIMKHSCLEHFSIIPTEKKGKILSGINADYFLDDYPENLIEATIESPKTKSFLLVRPYNAYFLQFITDSHKFKNIIPVYSVKQFLDKIENAG